MWRKNLILKSLFLSVEYVKPRSFVSSSSGGISISNYSYHEKIIPSLSVGTTTTTTLNKTISKLSRNGDLAAARSLFDRMAHRDVVSWNSMMSGCAQDGQYDQVLQLFLEIQQHALKPSHTSFSIVMSSCSKLGAFDQGRQIHGLSIKTRSSANEFVGSSLITMYSMCGVSECLIRIFDDVECPNIALWNALVSGFVLNHRVSDAREVFDRMPIRNVVSWTSMIGGYAKIKEIRHALELFELMPVKNPVSWSVMLGGLVRDGQFEKAIGFFDSMMTNGVQASAAIVTVVLSACSGSRITKQGRRIHCYVIKLGFNSDCVIEASLVLMYFRCLNAEEAKLEFSKMEFKFIGSWNSLIRGYIDSNKVDEARKFFNEMNERDDVSWNSMINGYLGINRIEDAIELFSEMPKPTIETCTALMAGFIETGRLPEAQQLFDMMPQRDTVAYTTLISGYMEEGFLEDAMNLYEEMPSRNVVTYNVIIHGLAQHGQVMQAYKFFSEAPKRDAISWKTLITAFVQHGFSFEAFQLCKEMILSDISPDKAVIASLLSASASLSLLSHGELTHGVAIKLGHESCLLVGNSLISLYSKCGDISIAKFIFDEIIERDLVTWNAMICGYAANGFGIEAIEMFENMNMRGIKPDDVTFLGILSACAHKCLLEEAQYYFNSMRDHDVVPRLTHYACMIDLLCRMGLIEKAERLVYSMPVEPDSAIWTSILSGCRLLSCKVDLAELAAQKLFALDPEDQMPYLHLMRIYESAGRWDDLQRMKNRMNKHAFNKRPGCSWIELNGGIKSFFAGDMMQCV